MFINDTLNFLYKFTFRCDCNIGLEIGYIPYRTKRKTWYSVTLLRKWKMYCIAGALLVLQFWKRFSTICKALYDFQQISTFYKLIFDIIPKNLSLITSRHFKEFSRKICNSYYEFSLKDLEIHLVLESFGK